MKNPFHGWGTDILWNHTFIKICPTENYFNLGTRRCRQLPEMILLRHILLSSRYTDDRCCVFLSMERSDIVQIKSNKTLLPTIV